MTVRLLSVSDLDCTLLFRCVLRARCARLFCLRGAFSASLDFRSREFKNAADMARQHGSLDERKNAVERLREFVRLNYLTGNQVAHRIGVRETTIYSWLSGNSTPRDARRIIAFLDSMPADSGRGIAPSGYEYREYRNWRGIPKPRRCPFCKKVKGVIEKVRGGFQGVCPSCGATGPKREREDEALAAWNGKGK